MVSTYNIHARSVHPRRRSWATRQRPSPYDLVCSVYHSLGLRRLRPVYSFAMLQILGFSTFQLPVASVALWIRPLFIFELIRSIDLRLGLALRD